MKNAHLWFILAATLFLTGTKVYFATHKMPSQPNQGIEGGFKSTTNTSTLPREATIGDLLKETLFYNVGIINDENGYKLCVTRQYKRAGAIERAIETEECARIQDESKEGIKALGNELVAKLEGLAKKQKEKEEAIKELGQYLNSNRN